MLSFSPLRIALLLAYFTLCSACGRPPAPDKNRTVQEQPPASTASDINFIGGGTQAPDTTPQQEPYTSPVISPSSTPTSLTWAANIDAAIRIASRDRRYKILLWFRSDECVECVNIERNIFTDPEVAANSRHWIFVKMDTAINPERAEYYLKGADPPAMVFLDQQGREYRRYTGSFTKEELITMLQTWD